MLLSDLVREMELWQVWGDLVGYVSTDARPEDADPHSIFGAACAICPERMAARLFGHYIGETLEQSAELFEQVLALAREGKRPHSWAELGLTADLFGRDEAA